MLDKAFVSAMRGDLPPIPEEPRIPPIKAQRFLPGKNVPEPPAEEIRKVDARLTREELERQGIYLSEKTYRDYREADLCSWAWMNPASYVENGSASPSDSLESDCAAVVPEDTL